MKFELPKEESSIIKVIGVGGGGSNAVNHMFNQGIIGVDFAICNTDAQAMNLSPVPNRIQLGPALTEGRGAGSRPNIGRQACLESIEEIQHFLEDNTKMIFITAGMGGGTGTGAAPIIAKLARELDILTVGIVTLPFTFEGRRRGSQAVDGLEEFKKHVDTLIVISNDKLREIHGNLTIREAFAHADNVLTTAAKGIAEIITVAGLVNVDFEDVNTVMRDSGVAIMGTAVADGSDRARLAVDQALNTPLLEDNDIRGAQHILLNIASGEKEVTMDEIFEITDFVQAEAGTGTDIIWGNCYDKSLGDRLAVTIIATGFEHRNRISADHGNELNNRKITVTLGEEEPEQPKAEQPSSGRKLYDTSQEGNNQRTIEFDSVMPSTPQQPSAGPSNRPSPPATEQEEQAERRRPAAPLGWMSGAPTKLNNSKVINELESNPAYVRKKVMLDDIPNSSEEGYGKLTVPHDGQGQVRSNNSFLHDHVD